MQAVVARVTADGTLDAGGGQGGHVSHDLGGEAVILAVAELADDRIVLAGLLRGPGRSPAVRACARMARSPPSFGASGFTDLVVLPDGDVVAGGSTEGDALLAEFPSR
jgi:CO/xanthine dehydrogenase Mo-binding subunit